MPTHHCASRWPRLLSLAGATAVLLHGVAQALELRRALRRGRRLAAAARAFEHAPAEGRAQVLLIGDSTGVGVGALRPEDSLPGRLAQRYPGACIVNRCRNGARVGDLRAQLDAAPVLRAPLAWWASRRTRQTMRRLARVAAAHGVPFVDFWRPRSRDPFGRHPARWFAADGLHPSGASYRHCFAVLDRRAQLASLLAPGRAHLSPGDPR